MKTEIAQINKQGSWNPFQNHIALFFTLWKSRFFNLIGQVCVSFYFVWFIANQIFICGNWKNWIWQFDAN